MYSRGKVGGRIKVVRSSTYRHAELLVTPQSGCVKANVGVVRLSDSIAVCGGLICDEISNWIIDFSRSLGCCPVLFAKLWGVQVALKHTWSLGHKRLVIETDNVEIRKIERDYNRAADALAPC
ncbi:hypothetical protein GQ457_02G032590 [Hibiscus cannabinus]